MKKNTDSHTKSQVAGLILPHNYFGSHLGNQKLGIQKIQFLICQNDTGRRMDYWKYYQDYHTGSMVNDGISVHIKCFDIFCMHIV